MTQKTFPHFMIDIETLGNTSNAAVVQIGIVGFDFETGKISEPFKINTSVHTSSQMDEATIRWWMQQSDEARKSVFSGEGDEPHFALSKLSGFLNTYGDNAYRVWSKPSTFDLVILENLYKNCGFDAPWKHWSTRCLRTLLDIAGFSRDFEVVPIIPHDAGYDAEAQAKTAIAAYNLLKKVDNGDTGG